MRITVSKTFASNRMLVDMKILLVRLNVVILYILTVKYASSECNDDGLRLFRDMYIVENVQTNSTNDRRPFETLPPGLSIRPSSIPGAGLGVWALREFPKNSRFGPYGGNKKKSIEGDEWAYAWQIYDLGINLKHYVDAAYPNSSNWVRYVNCARTVEEENLYLHQLDDEIYYVSYECIKPGTELLVWYGEEYGKELGLKRTAEDYQERFNEDDVKYIIENTLNENVNRIYTNCYKFFDHPPFRKPPGKFQVFDRYCLSDGSYQVCKYEQCQKNPCTNNFDCHECEGYCLHLGNYIKTLEKFDHADNTNSCICNEDGHFGCTINPQSLEKMCSL